MRLRQLTFFLSSSKHNQVDLHIDPDRVAADQGYKTCMSDFQAEPSLYGQLMCGEVNQPDFRISSKDSALQNDLLVLN